MKTSRSAEATNLGGNVHGGIYSGGSVARIICDSIVRYSERIAIFDDVNALTYAELGNQIGRFVTLYRSLGLGKGNGVALLTTNRIDAWPAVCAANILGIRYTPLHPMSSEEDQAFICEDSTAEVLIVDGRKFGPRGLALKARVPSLKHVFSFDHVEGARDVLAELQMLESSPLVDETDPEDIVWLTYTGGTTGRAKGVMLPHRSVATMSSIIASDWEWPGEIRFAVVTPMSHAAGIALYPVMMLGGSACFINGFAVDLFCRTVEKRRLTATFLVPTIINALLDAEEVRSRYDLSSLQLLVYGAAPIAPSQLLRAMEAFGPVLLQLYGQSEAPQVVTTLRRVDHDPTRPHLLSSCGLPNSLTKVALLGPDLKEVATGQAGEICLRGPLCSNGYWRQPELTELLFAGGWLHTGDVGIKDGDGYVYIVDRTKDMIISGGFNIYPREVEDALLTHDAVAMAAVIGIPDPKWGEAVKAFVTLRPGTSTSEGELQNLVKARRGTPWSPKSIDFVAVLPLTGLGKLDRKKLRAPFWEGRERGVS